MYDLPFAVGLQMMHADDVGKGRKMRWRNRSGRSKIDAINIIETAFKNASA